MAGYGNKYATPQPQAPEEDTRLDNEMENLLSYVQHGIDPTQDLPDSMGYADDGVVYYKLPNGQLSRKPVKVQKKPYSKALALLDLLSTGRVGPARAGALSAKGDVVMDAADSAVTLGTLAKDLGGFAGGGLAKKLKRARKLGFSDREWYHGTDRRFDAFDPAQGGERIYDDDANKVFLTTDPKTASFYAMDDGFGRARDGAQVYPLRLRERELLDYGEFSGDDPVRFFDENPYIFDDAIRQGKKGVLLQAPGRSALAVVGDPSIIRSRFAEFDPELVDGADLGYAGGGMVRQGVKRLRGALETLERSTKGKPDTVEIPGEGKVKAEPIKEIDEAAESYMKRVGRPGEHRLEEYPEFDEDRARAIAEAFDRMKHDPSDPEVRRSYEAMIDETLAQYRSLPGLDIKFLRPGQRDPYADSPAMGYADLVKHGRLWTFPTEQGFGSGVGGLDVSDNPLLKRVGRIGDLDNATANDAFRVVHDLYGHFGPGNPFFRHKGEERAWNQHSLMYSPEARGAMTSETRGQNSWLNFGPYAEHNRTAKGEDTVFADQKIGLLPKEFWNMQGRATGGFIEAINDNDGPKAKLNELMGHPDPGRGTRENILKWQQIKPLRPGLGNIRPLPANQKAGGGLIRRGVKETRGALEKLPTPAIKRQELLFDYRDLGEVPDVPQVDIPRRQPARGPSKRVQDAIDNPEVIRQVEDRVERGIDLGGPAWYNTEQLRQRFVAELGEEAGEAAYRRYLDYVAAASPMSNVPQNVRNASFYFLRDREGRPLPATADDIPNPYGHIGGWLHLLRARKIREGEGWNPMTAPKPTSFVENLAGNQRPVTVDKHATRLPAMASRDPRFLQNRVEQVDPETGEISIFRPKDAYEAGELDIDKALERPVFWADKPRDNEYGALERMYQDVGARKGLTPAQTQASAWVGAGDMTGLGSTADPFLKVFEDRVGFTAERLGLRKEDVLRRFMRGQLSLLKKGGMVSSAGALARRARGTRPC